MYQNMKMNKADIFTNNNKHIHTSHSKFSSQTNAFLTIKNT